MGIGPSTKETTLHHFKDPLTEIICQDEELNLIGIIVQGTPQSNESKIFTAERTAVLAQTLRADGAVVSTDGWGNSNIDFISLIDELNERKIATSGLSFIGTAGKFVMDSPNLKGIIDINKSESGTETCNVGENSMSRLDARKAVAVLKLKMRRDAL